jgi:hypothetical protein
VLFWLLHHKDGLMLIQRTLGKRFKKGTETMTREQDLQQLAKDFGPIKLAKHLIENGPSGLSEHDFVAAVDAWAKANNTTFV